MKNITLLPFYTILEHMTKLTIGYGLKISRKDVLVFIVKILVCWYSYPGEPNSAKGSLCMQDFSGGGGGPTLKFHGFWIYMPRSGMSRAAKLRAFARGVYF